MCLASNGRGLLRRGQEKPGRRRGLQDFSPTEISAWRRLRRGSEFRNLRQSVVEAHKHIIDRKGSRSSRIAATSSRKDAGDAFVAHARATAA
jgi:hypothetical protein